MRSRIKFNRDVKELIVIFQCRKFLIFNFWIILVCDPLILGFSFSLIFSCWSKNQDHNLWSHDLVICNFRYLINKRCDLLILIPVKSWSLILICVKFVIRILRSKNWFDPWFWSWRNPWSHEFGNFVNES